MALGSSIITADGINALANANATGTGVQPKYFKFSSQELVLDLNLSAEDVQGWRTQDISAYNKIDNNTVEFVADVLPAEATEYTRVCGLFLEDGTLFMIAKPPFPLPPGLRQTFKIQMIYSNVDTVLDFKYITNTTTDTDLRYMRNYVKDASKSTDVDQAPLLQEAVNMASANKRAIVNDFYQYSTRTGITFPKNASVIRVEPNDIKIFIPHCRRLLASGNSLTETRAATIGGHDSYIHYVEEALAAHHGAYKGLGLIPFSTYHTKDYGGSISHSSNVLEMFGESDFGFSEDLYTHTFDGKGLYTLGADGTEWISLTLPNHTRYTKIRLAYLKQPNGGTFKVGASSVHPSRRIDVDTASATVVRGHIDIDVLPEEVLNLRIDDISGDVAVLNTRFVDEESDDFELDVQARNGIRLKDIIALNEASQTAYFTEGAYDVAVINLPTNDANAQPDISPLEHVADLTTLANRIQTGSPDCKIIMMSPPQPKYYYSTATQHEEFDAATREACVQHGWGYIDTASHIGGYGELLGLGAMEDEVHPNSIGKKMMAQALLEYLDVPTLRTNKHARKEKISWSHKQTIQDAGSLSMSIGSTYTLINFGIIDVSETLYAEVELLARGTTNGFYKKMKFDLGSFGDTPRGEVAYARGLESVENSYESLGFVDANGQDTSSYDGEINIFINAGGETEVTLTPLNIDLLSYGIEVMFVGTKSKALDSIIIQKGA